MSDPTSLMVTKAIYHEELNKWSFQVGRYDRVGNWLPKIISPGIYKEPVSARDAGTEELNIMRKRLVAWLNRTFEAWSLTGGAA